MTDLIYGSSYDFLLCHHDLNGSVTHPAPWVSTWEGMVKLTLLQDLWFSQW